MNSSMAEARSVAVSEAQKAYLTKVYGWMVGGLFTTALVGGIIVSDQQIMMDVLSYRWILIIAQFGLVIALSGFIEKMNTITAMGSFLLYSALNGLTLSALLLIYSETAIVTSFLSSAGMFGAIVMLPLYLQVVKGDSATTAGLKLIPLMLGIVTTSIISGKLISKHGHYKRFPVAGTFLMTIGILLMTRLQIDTPFWQISIYAVMVGAGLGLSMQTIVIALQNSIDFKDMGVATSSNTFFRSLGSVFGTAIFGSILTNRVGHYLESNFTQLATSNPAALNGFEDRRAHV